MSPRFLARTVSLIYVIFLVFVLLNPSAQVPSSGVGFLAARGEDLGLPVWLTARTEPIANVAIFVPLPVLGTVLFGRRPLLTWTGLAFAASLAVEVTQRFLLTSRSGSTDDVVANTSGAFLGGLLVTGLVAWDKWPRGEGTPGPQEADPERIA